MSLKYNAYYYSVTQIESQSHGQAPQPSTHLLASGFFFAHRGKKYLITNRHIVINEKTGMFPDHLKFYIHLNKDDPKSIRYVSVPLYKDCRKLWLEHVDNDPSDDKKIIDVVAIEISSEMNHYDKCINYWSTKNMELHDASLYNSFINISLIGYPLGFYDEENMLPIKRSGAIASLYGADFRERPRFLVDIITHKGCSGSPVFLEIGDGNHLYGDLLGVLSGAKAGLNLGYAWHSYLITQIIERKQLDDK